MAKMKIPKTFILDRNFDEKIKELSEKYLRLPKEELYRHVINKHGFFKPDQEDNLSTSHSNLYLAILSILNDESYTLVTSYEPRYKKHKANDKLISIITIFDQTYRIGYIHEERRLFALDFNQDVEKARKLASRLNEELRLDLKLKQYTGHRKYISIKI